MCSGEEGGGTKRKNPSQQRDRNKEGWIPRSYRLAASYTAPNAASVGPDPCVIFPGRRSQWERQIRATFMFSSLLNSIFSQLDKISLSLGLGF